MTFRRLAFLAVTWLAIFIALFSSALIILFETGALTPYVVESLDARLQPAGLAFRAESIHWRPWSGLSLRDVLLESRPTAEVAGADSAAAPRHVVSLRRLEVGYRLQDILRADLSVARVHVLRPVVDLDALLAWSSGAPRSAADTTSAPGGASFRIDSIRLVHGRLRARDRDLLRDFSVRGSLEAAPGDWRLRIDEEHGRLNLGRFDEDITVRGDLALADGLLRIDDVVIEAVGGRARLRGSADPRGARPSEIVVRAESVPLKKVGEWLDVAHPLLFADLALDAVVSGRPDSVRVSANLTGTDGDGVERRIAVTGVRQGSRLVLENLRWVAEPSRLELSGRMDLAAGPSVEGVAVFRDLEPAVLLADPELSALGDLDGTMRFAGTGLTRATFRGGADVHLEGASAFGLRFGGGTLAGTLDRGTLRVDRARLVVGGSGVAGHGTIDADNRVDAELHGEIADLAVLSRIGGAVRAADPRGRGSATVRVVGPVRAPELDAVLRLEDVSVGGLDAERLSITAESVRLGATRVDFRAEGTGVGKGTRRFEVLRAAGWADGGALVLRSLDLEAEAAVAALSGRLDFGDDGRLAASVDRLSLRAADGSATWENAGPVRVSRAGTTVTVTGLDLRGDGGSVAGEVTVLPSGAAAIRATGRAMDLALFAPFVGVRGGMTGTLELDAAAVVGADTLAADVRFALAGARLRDRAADSVSGRIVLADGVRLDDVEIVTPGGRAVVRGELVPPAGSLREALADREARTRALERATLHDVRARLESPDFSWLWARIPRAPVSAGAGSVEVRLDGPFLAPTGDVHAELAGGAVGDEPLDSFVADAVFDGEILSIRNGLLVTGGHTLSVSGVVPLEWTADDPRPRLREGREVDLGMVATGLPLEALSRMIPLFEIMEGTADARVGLRGPPGELRLGGEFAVTRARLDIPAFDEPLLDGTARGTFDARGVDIASAAFRDARGGIVTGSGRVTLENLRATDYVIDVTARDYHYRSAALDIHGLGSGSMRILARTASDGRVIPFFQGRFRVARADIGPKALAPPSAETGGAGSGLPPGVVGPPEPAPRGPEGDLVTLPPTEEPPAPAPVLVLAEIALKGDRNIWVKTPEMDVEVAADVVFHATETTTGLTGQVTTLRGTYSVLNSRFDVDRADVEFTDPANPGSSYIDAQASTTVLDENVTVYVTGTAAEPNIRLETESGMSEAEIYELLALRIKRGENGGAQEEGVIGDAFRRSYVAALTNRFGGELGRELGLDTFAYEDGETGARPSVTLGKNVGRDFFFKYRQAVGGTGDPAQDASLTREALESPERALTIEYRLNRIFMLQGETGTLPPGDDYLNVDLRAEWGY